jgi:hypothetical protein
MRSELEDPNLQPSSIPTRDMTEAEVDKWMKFYRRFQWPDPATELNQIKLKHGTVRYQMDSGWRDATQISYRQ